GTVYYSLNGAAYKKYTSAVKLTKNSTVKAYAQSGSTKSKTVTFTYKLKPKVTVSATDTSGGKNVKLTTKVSGVKLYYTTDGSKPTTSSKAYTSSGIKLTKTGKLRFVAIKSGWSNASYTKDITVTGKSSTLPETDASLFSYNEENGAIALTNYKGSIYKDSDKVVVIPSKINGKPVTKIGSHLFDGGMDYGSFVTSVTIPNTVTHIEQYAFYNCPLTSLTIPNSVTYINIDAFSGCDHLTSVTLPNSASIGNQAFAFCSSLKSVTIPGGITRMGVGVFYYCESLTSVTLEDGVPYINDSAFNSCTSLKSINIPDSVKAIGLGAFGGCTSLTSITIPGSVESIDDIAFENCTSLASLTISDGVKEIGENAFTNCTSLTHVDIPDSVTKIASGRDIDSWIGIDNDMGAFAGCKCTVTYKGRTYSPNEYEALYSAINGN
ncbi:MAG: leucine-rich repeat protein, partial [Oscillospiraceae bacterium]|nr:leucine-rich repeat protein [Oscillospiraceae bacterium]